MQDPQNIQTARLHCKLGGEGVAMLGGCKILLGVLRGGKIIKTPKLGMAVIQMFVKPSCQVPG